MINIANTKSATWRISSRCMGGNGCVEVANFPSAVAVRDSTDRQGPLFTFPFEQWSAFIAGVRDREFISS